MRDNYINSIHSRIILSITLLAPIFYLGIGNKYPWALLGEHGKAIGIIFFFFMTVLFFSVSLLPVANRFSTTSIQKFFAINLLLSVAFSIGYDAIQYRHFLKFGYQKPLLLYILGVMALTLLVIFRNKLKVIFVLCGLYSIFHYAVSIYYFPLVIARSDMLAAVAASINQFLHNISPYYQSSTNIGIPPYLPVTMLSFIPASLLKLDFRLVGLFYWILAIGLITYKQYTFSTIQKMALCLLIVNPYFLMRHDLYFQCFLLEIVILCLYFSSFNFIAKGIFLGFFIATLQFAWILYPFILLAENRSMKNLVIMLSISLIVGISISLLYVHNGISDFFHAIFLHKEYLSPYSSDITFGLSTIFYFANSQILLYVIQIAICVLIILTAIHNYMIKPIYTRNYYISLSAICYLIFMSTNYFIETYLLIPMLLFLILSLNHSDTIN